MIEDDLSLLVKLDRLRASEFRGIRRANRWARQYHRKWRRHLQAAS